MSIFKKLSHVIYRCNYHIVWTPKYKFRVLEGLVKELLTKDMYDLKYLVSGNLHTTN